MEQDTGVEPAFTAWEAVVLPIYESCMDKGIIAKGHGNFNHFLSKDQNGQVSFAFIRHLWYTILIRRYGLWNGRFRTL